MISAARCLMLGVVLLAGCHSAQKAAVTTFRVIDTPAHYIRERIDHGDTTTTTTTTTTATTGVSDVTNPGRPVSSPPPKYRAASSSDAAARTEATTSPPRKSSTSATPRPAAAPTSFPTAKPVPGKPGYVYSIDPKGGIIDVTGYKPGDKAKDPYTKQIFIVP